MGHFREPDELDSKDIEVTQLLLKDHFKGEYPTPENWTGKLAELFADSFFAVIGSHTSRKMALKTNNPIYVYEYTHPSSFGLLDILFSGLPKLVARMAGRYLGLDLFKQSLGVAHGDELMVMWKSKMLPIDTRYTDNDKMAGNNLLKLWTNFAKFGNPTPNKEELGVVWKRYSYPSHVT